MADANIDYDAVLADLKAKRDKLDAAIAGIETMLGLKGLTTTVEAGANGPGAVEGPGAFLGMSIVDATVSFLRRKRQAQRTEEIVSALRQGGLAFASVNAINTVGSVLNRNYSQGGDIVRVSRGVWGLAEWYPRLRKKVDGKSPLPASPETESSEEQPLEDFVTGRPEGPPIPDKPTDAS